MLKIKKGDKVEIITGKDKGRQGKVISILPKAMKIVVEGVNISVKHIKPKQSNTKGERINVESPIHISNVMLVCSEKNIRTRVGFDFDGDNKIRFSKKSKSKLD